MPYISLDAVHPVLVSPVEDEVITVKVLGGAARSKEDTPPTSTSGTERAENAEVTIEPNQRAWFITKAVAAGEATPAVTLEVKQAASGGVDTADIQTGAVTEAKLASEAVTAGKIAKEAATSAKALPATTPAAGAEKSVVVGTGGVARKITAVHVGDGAETKVKVKHAFNTFAVLVTVQKGAETKKPGENYLNAAGAGNFTVAPISAEEVEITFGTAPIAKFESFITVVA